MGHADKSVFQRSRTILLKCPKCGAELTGLPIDRIFFCNQCRIGVDFWEDPPGIINISYAGSSEDAGCRTIMLPVWYYELEIQIHSDNQVAAELARQAAPGKMWVFGSVFQKLNLYGNHHVEFSRQRPKYVLDGESQDLVGCQLRRWHADKLLIPLVSAVIDLAQDVTDLEIDITIRQRELHALPFEMDNKYLRH
ncbi:hypothetical protein K8T06_13540, partial [bacterium]|nr:hypothetical protein [bacterium]